MGYFVMGVLVLIGLNALALSTWLRMCKVISRQTEWIVTLIVFVAAYFIGVNADKILGM